MNIICPHCNEKYTDVDMSLCNHFVECAKCNQQFYIPPMALFDNALVNSENAQMNSSGSTIADCNTSIEQEPSPQQEKKSYLAVDDGERIPFKRPRRYQKKTNQQTKESYPYMWGGWAFGIGLLFFYLGVTLSDQGTGLGFGALFVLIGALAALVGFIALFLGGYISIWWHW